VEGQDQLTCGLEEGVDLLARNVTRWTLRYVEIPDGTLPSQLIERMDIWPDLRLLDDIPIHERPLRPDLVSSSPILSDPLDTRVDMTLTYLSNDIRCEEISDLLNYVFLIHQPPNSTPTDHPYPRD